MKNLSLHILDIVQNSIAARASLVEVDIDEALAANTLEIVVTDNGRGMSAEVLDKVSDPYFTSRTTRKVGLGIPLLKQNAMQTGGKLSIESSPGKGTRLVAMFVYDHIDRPAMGDIPGVISMLCGANPELELVYRHRIDDREYHFDTREVKEALGDVPLSEPGVIRFLREMIKENLINIQQTSKQ